MAEGEDKRDVRPQESFEDLPAEEIGSSSFHEPPDSIHNTETLSRSATHDFGDNVTPLPGPKRVRTAPADARPRFGRKSNTLLRSSTKRTTSSYSHGPPGTYFRYKFDPMLSDEESDSSSSSEDEAPVKRREHELTEEASKQQEQLESLTGDAKVENLDNEERRRFSINNGFFRTRGRVSRRDGRLKISINETANSGYFAQALGQSIRNHLNIPNRARRGRSEDQKKKTEDVEVDADVASIASSLHETTPRPRLNIVIMVIGSRGDIQPFLKIGKILSNTYGHRVRIASHPVFRDFVEKDVGLEFFSVGGDPSELMAFMVRNPGLIPSMQTLREGEIQRRRDQMGVMFEGFWRACISSTEGETDKCNLQLMKDKWPFIADAIIANPPSMAHVHIAERLGIPLHMMFTFPYTPTTQFPHPLANIKMRKSNVDAQYVNFMSYPLVEMMTWQGLGDIVNRFREQTLGLEPVSSLWAPGALYRMKVPYTYLWSPSLVPKPKDWGPEIDLAGFVFLELAKDFEPPKELADFLAAGEPPVYIGFGSIVVDDPNEFTDMIFKAAEIAGVRALVNKGWGGLGRDNKNTPKNIYMLGNTPHDWLFPKVKAVVHHGGAGTTAIGLKCAKPTMIVPFFGDQPFWGAMVAEAKAGAHECIPYKRLTAERLAEGIKQCLTKEAQQNVQKIADRMAREGDGAENAVKSFQRSLPFAGKHNMRCSILQERVAVWQIKKSSLRLCALAAEILHEQGRLKWTDLKLLRHYEWNDFDGPGEPLTGSVGALTDSLYGIGEGFGMVPVRIARHIRKREEHERRKRLRQKRKEELERKKAQTNAGIAPEQKVTTNGTSLPTSQSRPSVSREPTNTTLGSTLSADPTEPLPLEVIDDLNWGLKRAGAAILTMPNDLGVAIAQGLHNTPRLYGDSTVRKPVRITGVKSGFTAARKEFAYGIYDGWTGLVKQPKGDWEDGENITAKFAGLGTGIGKGLGGFVLKNANALFAPTAYVTQGLIKYIEKHSDGQSTKAFIRRSHLIQGEKELRDMKRLARTSISAEPNDPSQLEHQQELELIRARVDHGWAVYNEIWDRAYDYFGPVGGNIVGKYKLKKERRKWDVNGALENVHTANQALQAKKEGDDLTQFFAQRKEEMRRAELPRVSVMEPVASNAETAGQEKGEAGLVNKEEAGHNDKKTSPGDEKDLPRAGLPGRGDDVTLAPDFSTKEATLAPSDDFTLPHRDTIAVP